MYTTIRLSDIIILRHLSLSPPYLLQVRHKPSSTKVKRTAGCDPKPLLRQSHQSGAAHKLHPHSKTHLLSLMMTGSIYIVIHRQGPFVLGLCSDEGRRTVGMLRTGLRSGVCTHIYSVANLPETYNAKEAILGTNIKPPREWEWSKCSRRHHCAAEP